MNATAIHLSRECAQLAALKQLSYEDLIELGMKLYNGDSSVLQTIINSIINSSSNLPLKDALAETLYYRQSTIIIADYRFGDLTRHQLEHECVSRGLFRAEQAATARDYDLQMSLRWDEQQLREAAGAALGDSSSGPDSGYATSIVNGSLDGPDGGVGEEPSDETGDESADDEDDGDISDGDDHRKDIYVKVWKPELGRYVTFRY